MSFANPYNFVGIKNKVNRKKINDINAHNKIVHEGNYTGILKCILKTTTEMFIPSMLQEDIEKERVEKDKTKIHIKFKSFYYVQKENGQRQYAIPASSLKGLIRSTSEAISNSCLHMFDGKYEKDSINYNVDNALHKDQCIFYDEKGNLASGLCICCNMFGMANAKESKDKNSDIKTPNVFKGRIRFYDALLISQPHFEAPFILKELSSPKPHHREFYAKDKTIRGRKFYYHHYDYPVDRLKDREKTNRNRTIIPLTKGALFEFTISFENLTRDEYGLLLTTLELEPGLGHKIGMGKPLGLGSCVIEVTEIKEFTKNRYLSLEQAESVKSYKGDDLKNRKKEVKTWWTKGIPEDLKCILRLNNGFTQIRYPVKDMYNPSKDEFQIYKKLHDPCREFSDDDKKGATSESNKPKGSNKPDRTQHKGGGVMAEAFKKALKKRG